MPMYGGRLLFPPYSRHVESLLKWGVMGFRFCAYFLFCNDLALKQPRGMINPMLLARRPVQSGPDKIKEFLNRPRPTWGLGISLYMLFFVACLLS